MSLALVAPLFVVALVYGTIVALATGHLISGVIVFVGLALILWASSSRGTR